jgi:hypothetical protein
MDKQVRVLVEEAQRQGWTARPTKKGWLLLAPDGVGMVTIHGTPSDSHWLGNAVSRMRKHGFVWPPGR